MIEKTQATPTKSINGNDDDGKNNNNLLWS